MDPVNVGFIGFGAVLLLIALRFPIGVALGGVAILGMAYLRDFNIAFGLLEGGPFEFAASWTLSAIPMFLLMGAVAHYSGISNALFYAARMWFGRLPGGLAVATNFGCAAFAAASGSSTATAAAFGKIAIPEMRKANYDMGLATGVVASAGTLGTLIPPSVGMLIYGIFAEVSISKLFIAGILPGILSAAIYGGMIVIRCKLNPELAPVNDEKPSFREKVYSLKDVWPLVVLIIAIMGGLYTGWFTPTEAGAGGAAISLLITYLQRRLTWDLFRRAIVEALSATSRIFFVAIGAVMLTKFMAMSETPFYMAEVLGTWAGDPLYLVIACSVIYIVLGMFMDPLGIKLLTLPIMIPMFEALKLDLIWFGILVVKFVEIGLITPPVGFNVYVIKSVVEDQVELDVIFKGVTWFLVCDIITLAILIMFPEISTYLPSLMD